MKKHLLQLSLAACLGLPAAALAQGTYLRAPDGDPTNAVVVAPGGNVGIGTSTPFFGNKLEAFDAVHASIASRGPEAGFKVMDTSGINAWTWQMRPDVGGANNDLKLLRYNSDGYQGIAVQVQSSTGNVGIGGADAVAHVGGRRALVVASSPEQNGAFVEIKGNLAHASIIQSHNGDTYVGGLRRGQGTGNTYLSAGDGLTAITARGTDGNVGIGTINPQAKLDVNGKINCTVLELTSDRNQKQDIRSISVAEVLAKVAALPGSTWAYTNSPGVRHLGPMAQDFKAAFNLGEDDRHIGAGDGIGVALAAIKGLHELVQEKDSEIVALKRELAGMKQELASVKDSVTDRLAALEKVVAKRNVQQASFRPEATR